MTTTDVARRDATSAVAIRPGQEMFDDRQTAALAVLGVKDATKADLAVYFHVCQQTGLDPFLKQIYLIARQEKVRDQWVTKQTIQVGIDGFRVIRDRAAKREGIEVEYSRTIWYDSGGGEHKVWLRAEPPAGCEMTVYKDGRPYPAVLTFAEYVQTNRDGKPTGKWRDAPAHQLEKCVEAFALRRAFPQDMAGVRLPEEMGDDDAGPPAAAVRTARGEIVRERPRQPAGPAPATGQPAGHEPAAGPVPTASPGDRTEQGDGSADPTDSRAEPDAAAEPSRPARPSGAAMGKLGKLLTQIPLGDPDAVRAYIEWQTGHSALEQLSRDDVTTLTQHLTSHLSAAEGNTEAAAGRIWEAYHEAIAASGEDGEARG